MKRTKAKRKAAFRAFASRLYGRALSLHLDATMRDGVRWFRPVRATGRLCAWCMFPLRDGGAVAYRIVRPARLRATLCRHCVRPSDRIGPPR